MMQYTDDPELLARMRRDRDILFRNIQGRCRQLGVTFSELSACSEVPLYIFEILEARDLRVDFEMEYIVRICYYLDRTPLSHIFTPGRYYDEAAADGPPSAEPQP